MTSFRTRTAAQALLFALAASLVITTAHGADQKWWHTSSPNAAVNGQIVLKNGTGATRTVNNNPTGATLATRTANTQPPTVVVQATATLPVVAEGSACNNAVDTAAVNSDKTLILTCQSGTNGTAWARSYLPTITVVSGPSAFGNFATGQSHYSYVECPLGYNLTGGGSQLVTYNPYYPNAISNAPDTSAPYFNWTKGKYTGWSVAPGGASGYSEFIPFAVCGK